MIKLRSTLRQNFAPKRSITRSTLSFSTCAVLSTRRATTSLRKITNTNNARTMHQPKTAVPSPCKKLFSLSPIPSSSRHRPSPPQSKSYYGFQRQFCSAQPATKDDTNNPQLSDPNNNQTKPPLRSFDQIPGPKGVPVFGNMLQIISEGNKFESVTAHRGFQNMHLVMQKWHEEYGPIVRYRLMDQNWVTLSNPNHIRDIFSAGGKFPKRIAIDPLIKYSEMYNDALDLSSAQGEEWYNYRKTISPAYLAPRSIESYYPSIKESSQDFVQLLSDKCMSNNGVAPDLEHLLSRYAIDAMTSILFGQSIWHACKDPLSEQSKQFMEGSLEMIQGMGKILLRPPYYKMLPNPLWDPLFKKFVLNMKFLMDEGRKVLAENGNDLPNNALMKQILASSGITKEQQSAIIVGAMIAGVDTTRNSMTWILYHLSKNPKVQEQAFEMIQQVCPDERVIGKTEIGKLPIIKHIINESLRLTTVIPANNRILESDFELDGYIVPSGTLCALNNYSASVDPNYWEDPQKFNVDRWNDLGESYHGFASLTFGQGSRSCLGQKIAMAEMSVAVIDIIKNFKMTYANSVDLAQISVGFLLPNIPVLIKFEPRK